MKEQAKRVGLLILALAPIASVAFAAKSALSIAQINKAGATDHQLSQGTSESHS